jgi:iron(III) transport system permease protein
VAHLNSVKLALVSGIAGTVLTLLAAYIVERRRPPGARALEFLGLLPAALPGTLVGVGYILAFNVPPVLLTGTIWILVTSVVFWKFPVAVLAAINALKQIDPAVEEAAVSLGAGPPGRSPAWCCPSSRARPFDLRLLLHQRHGDGERRHLLDISGI